MVSAYIALYLFFAGAGSGSFLIGSVVDLVLRFRPQAVRGWFARVSVVTDAGLVVGPILVLLGTLFLVLDLGVPERALRLFLVVTPSLLSLGAWAIVLFCAASGGALALGWVADRKGLDATCAGARVGEFALSVAATALALFVMCYSGVLLSTYPSLPFLHTPLVPVVFVASAFATGLAALIVVAFFRQAVGGVREAVRSCLMVDMALVAVESITLFALVSSSLSGGEAVAGAARTMMAGPCAPLFWVGVVVVGLVAPFSIDVICWRIPSLTALVVGAGCTLIGGVCLRFSLLMATQRFNLVFMSALGFWS